MQNNDFDIIFAMKNNQLLEKNNTVTTGTLFVIDFGFTEINQ